MEKEFLEHHRTMTERHLDHMRDEVESAAELRAEDRYRREIWEQEPTERDVRLNRLTPTQKEFDHERAVHNILETLKKDEEGGQQRFSWKERKGLLRRALSEIDQLLNLLGISVREHPEKLALRTKIAKKLSDMEEFMTERHLTGAVNELLDKPEVYRQVMEQVWEEIFTNPVVRGTIEGEWQTLYDEAERRLMQAVKQEQSSRGLPWELERRWFELVLQKLDVASAVFSDEVAKDMKMFVIRKLGELDREERTLRSSDKGGS